MNTPEENAAIATCNSWLNVAGLPTYTQLQERIAELEAQLAAPVAVQEPGADWINAVAKTIGLSYATAKETIQTVLEAQPAPSERQPASDWTSDCANCGGKWSRYVAGSCDCGNYRPTRA